MFKKANFLDTLDLLHLRLIAMNCVGSALLLIITILLIPLKPQTKFCLSH